jgi:hypothetical protein
MRAVAEPLGAVGGAACLYTMAAICIAAARGRKGWRELARWRSMHPAYLWGCGLLFVVYDLPVRGRGPGPRPQPGHGDRAHQLSLAQPHHRAGRAVRPAGGSLVAVARRADLPVGSGARAGRRQLQPAGHVEPCAGQPAGLWHGFCRRPALAGLLAAGAPLWRRLQRRGPVRDLDCHRAVAQVADAGRATAHALDLAHRRPGLAGRGAHGTGLQLLGARHPAWQAGPAGRGVLFHPCSRR